MAYNEKLANRIRHALIGLSKVEEKRMFGGIAFMVDGKMCLTAGANRMMCRIDPDIHETVIRKGGCCTVIMRGRGYKGYIYVNEDSLLTQTDFDYWVRLALDFNKKAKASGKKAGESKALP